MQGNPIPTPDSIGAQPLDADLTAYAALSTTGLVERTGAGTVGTVTATAFAKTLLDDADAATARGTLGGSATGQNFFTLANPGAITFPRINADNSISALSAADFRTALSVPDIELGDWTPTIVGTSSAGTGTYSEQLGSYVRIGGVWFIFFRVVWTGHTGTGNTRVANLPVTVGNSTIRRSAVTFAEYSAMLPANTLLMGRGVLGNSAILLGTTPIGGGTFSGLTITNTGTVEGTFILRPTT